MSLNTGNYRLVELEHIAYQTDNVVALEILARMEQILNTYFSNKGAFDKIMKDECIKTESERDSEDWFGIGAEIVKWFMERDASEVFDTERTYNGVKFYGCSAFDENTNCNNHHLRLERAGGERWKLTVHHSEYGESVCESYVFAKTITTARKEAVKEIVNLLVTGKIVLEVV